MPVSITPLDSWIAGRIGADSNGQDKTLSAAAIRAYQLDKLGEILEYARTHSSFHGARLEQLSGKAIRSFEDFRTVPFMDHTDLREHAQNMLCVQQDDIARIVTMQSSGTTGKPKRLFFSEQDLELTIDFFHNGIQTMVRPGERMLILLPGPTPDSTGDLLARGLARMGAEGIVHGLVQDPCETLRTAHNEQVDSLVGFPVQVLSLARLDAQGSGPRLNPKTVLLCSDYISRSIADFLEKIWGCKVFSHWGTVETGLGGGVECEARQGCHLRQADLFLEIIGPHSLQPLPDGDWGEIVLTTLTRRAMPIIRYRTGDIGRLLSERCACGSAIVRLDKVRGRMADSRPLANGHHLRLPLLDEVIFAFEQVMDYQARLQAGNGGERLIIELGVLDDGTGHLTKNFRAALEAMPELQDTDTGRGPAVDLGVELWSRKPYTAAKRILLDER